MTKRAIGISLALLVLIYAGVAMTLYVAQRRIVFRPDKHRPDAALVGLPDLHQVWLQTQGGLQLIAWWLPPSSATHPVLLYFHGNGGNLSDRGDRLRFFAASGDGVLMPEYPGYGGNQGEPSERSLFGTATAALEFLRVAHIENWRVAIYGESLGTGVAAFAAAGPRFGALIMESPFTSITAIARQQYWFLPVDLLVRDRFDTLDRIGHVTSPLLVAVGEQDDIVPSWMGHAIFTAAPKPKQLWTAPSGGHENLAQFGLLDAVEQFLHTTIRPP